jgi:hypothetical protein
MSCDKVPNHVWRYCNQLDNNGWIWFYEQIKEPLKLVADMEFLFYTLKWILKEEFDDLSYELYAQYIIDPECRYDGMIKPEWLPRLEKRYGSKLENELCDIYKNLCLMQDDTGDMQAFSADSLPF